MDYIRENGISQLLVDTMTLDYMVLHSSESVIELMLVNDILLTDKATSYAAYLGSVHVLKLLLTYGCPVKKWVIWYMDHANDCEIRNFLRLNSRLLCGKIGTYMFAHQTETPNVDYAIKPGN